MAAIILPSKIPLRPAGHTHCFALWVVTRGPNIRSIIFIHTASPHISSAPLILNECSPPPPRVCPSIPRCSHGTTPSCACEHTPAPTTTCRARWLWFKSLDDVAFTALLLVLLPFLLTFVAFRFAAVPLSDLSFATPCSDPRSPCNWLSCYAALAVSSGRSP